jgi:hypothetical protein
LPELFMWIPIVSRRSFALASVATSLRYAVRGLLHQLAAAIDRAPMPNGHRLGAWQRQRWGSVSQAHKKRE